LRLQDHTQSE